MSSFSRICEGGAMRSAGKTFQEPPKDSFIFGDGFTEGRNSRDNGQRKDKDGMLLLLFQAVSQSAIGITGSCIAQARFGLHAKIPPFISFPSF